MTPEEITKHAWDLVLEAVHARWKKAGLGGDMTLEKIGEICGATKPTIQRWLNSDEGGKKTAFPDMLRYLEAFGIPLEKIFPAFSGRNVVYEPEIVQEIADTRIRAQIEHVYGPHGHLGTKSINPVQGIDFDYVPLVLGLQESGELDLDENIRRWPINMDYLIKNGGHGSQCMFFVFGTSMEDTLPDRSLIMVNRGDKDIHPDGKIYLISMNKELMVRRLQDRLDGTLMVKADNKKFDSYPLDKKYVADGSLKIFGRMIFSCMTH